MSSVTNCLEELSESFPPRPRLTESYSAGSIYASLVLVWRRMLGPRRTTVSAWPVR